ncbi:MAG: SagB family peptide dehydrogenase [Acidobacteriota bacterium]
MSAIRRSAHAVAHWTAAGLVLVDSLTNRPLPASPDDVALLDRLWEWTSVDRLAAAVGRPADEVRSRLARFRDHGLIEDLSSPAPSVARAAVDWRPWGAATAWFHQATRDVGFDADATGQPSRLAAPLMPRPQWPRRDGPRVALDPPPTAGALPETLLARRTWRRFGDAPLTRGDLSALLGLTWAVQAWGWAADDCRLPLKTSPSGGACHSIEVYLLALSVEGLAPGWYHYDADAHALSGVAPADAARVGVYLPGQSSFARASGIFVMTSVFDRVLWKYRSARAYRVILLEAGHLAQTFCLVASWLGLAPFTTAAVAESAIEADLGLVDMRESVLYAAGVGARPSDAPGWAPFPDGTTFRRTPPDWRRSPP